MTNEITRFLVCGAIAALVALGLRVLFSFILSFEAATFCAQIVAMVVGYYLYRYVVWANTTRSQKATILPFIAVNLASIAFVLVVSVAIRPLLIKLFGMSEIADTLAHATGIAFGAGFSLIGHRTFTFR